MRFERPDQAGTHELLRGSTHLDGLALFPSEIEIRRASPKSSVPRVEAASLGDFPSESLAAAQPPATRTARQGPAPPPGYDSVARPAIAIRPSVQSADAGGARLSRAAAWTTGLIFIAAFAATLGALSGVTPIGRRSPDSGGGSVPNQQRDVQLSPAPMAVHGPDEPQPEYQSAAAAIDTAKTRQEPLPAPGPPVVLASSLRRHADPTESSVATGKSLASANAAATEQPSPKLTQSSRTAPDRQKFQGALSLETSVPGAQVYVDGHADGLTPLSERPLAAGSHVIRIECDGYERWSAVIRVIADETTHVIANLRPIDVK